MKKSQQHKRVFIYSCLIDVRHLWCIIHLSIHAARAPSVNYWGKPLASWLFSDRKVNKLSPDKTSRLYEQFNISQAFFIWFFLLHHICRALKCQCDRHSLGLFVTHSRHTLYFLNNIQNNNIRWKYPIHMFYELTHFLQRVALATEPARIEHVFHS